MLTPFFNENLQMILVEYIVIVLPVVEILFDDSSKEKIFNAYSITCSYLTAETKSKV